MQPIKSLNAASYISTITNVVATIETDPITKRNFYRFDRTPEVLAAYADYRDAVARQGNLMANLIRYNMFIKQYKVASSKAKRSLGRS